MFIPIIGFEDKYKIDEYGNVLNLKTGSIMRPYINNKGYKVIDLMKKWNQIQIPNSSISSNSFYSKSK